jgi:hypothetical protein
MGFKSGRVSFSRFVIDNGSLTITPEFIGDRIKKFAFRDIFPEAAQESVGWTSLDNILDTSFANVHCIDDRYRLFAMRIDRRVVPGSVMKMRVMQEEERTLKENGKKRLYREQREAIRESVRLALQKIIPPVPKIIEVVWNVEEGCVYLGSLSPSIADEFKALFYETFLLLLKPAQPLDLAECKGRIDPLTINRDFLTWLWFKTEERDGEIVIPGYLLDLNAFFVGRVTLESGEGEYAACRLQGGQRGSPPGQESHRGPDQVDPGPR